MNASRTRSLFRPPTSEVNHVTENFAKVSFTPTSSQNKLMRRCGSSPTPTYDW
jgi:hypothetical protein